MQEIKQNREKRYPASTYADGQAVDIGPLPKRDEVVTRGLSGRDPTPMARTSA